MMWAFKLCKYMRLRKKSQRLYKGECNETCLRSVWKCHSVKDKDGAAINMSTDEFNRSRLLIHLGIVLHSLLD